MKPNNGSPANHVLWQVLFAMFLCTATVHAATVEVFSLQATVKDVKVTHVEADEIWSFIGMKEKQRIAGKHTGDEGSSWTFVAIDRHSKLILAHQIGQRTNETCSLFLRKLNAATVGKFQLSTDGHGMYSLNVPFSFQGWVDFGQMIKHFQNIRPIGRYSPPRIIKAERRKNGIECLPDGHVLQLADKQTCNSGIGNEAQVRAPNEEQQEISDRNRLGKGQREPAVIEISCRTALVELGQRQRRHPRGLSRRRRGHGQRQKEAPGGSRQSPGERHTVHVPDFRY